MEETTKRLTVQEVVDLGFEKIPHFTIGNNHILKLGRNRHLSFGCIGTPNEMLCIASTDPDNEQIITDLVVIHNYDYDK